MRFSVVTVSFNQARYVERTIRSVLDQKGVELEYIVIDGGSTDETVDILRRYDRHIAEWVSEPDQGQTHAINKGLKRAKGELVGWLNSDDTLAPGALAAVAAAAEAYPEADLFYGNTVLIDAEDRPIRRLASHQTSAFEIIRFNRNTWAQPGTFWRRSLHDRIGYLDESLHYMMDCEWWCRVALSARIRHIPRHLGNLRLHAGTKTASAHPDFLREPELLDRRYGREYRGPLARRAYRQYRRLRILTAAGNWLFLLGRLERAEELS